MKMRYYFMSKSKQLFFLLGLIFSFVEVSGAQQCKKTCAFHNHMLAGRVEPQNGPTSTVPLPIDIVKNMMKTHCGDFQSRYQLGATCRDYNRCYRDIMICK